ncbi:uncharacterized protein LOC143029040 [Oratosquilla oratoria]|uniref:uncharacterized protein LOC143029040 n=1 Tax=Oratosquilla oratoria TaxID=337810 RepID=UPI003F760831
MVVCLLAATVPVHAEPCCGAAVIGGLAVAGGALLGAKLHHHHHHHGGYGGCGGGCGGYYGRRRKRNIETFLADLQVQEAYTKVAAEDKEQCGLRLVCELAQKAPQDLAEDEAQILLPFRGAGPSDGTSAYSAYDEAAWHGQLGHNCSQEYQLCSYTAQQVMAAYRKFTAEQEGGSGGVEAPANSTA